MPEFMTVIIQMRGEEQCVKKDIYSILPHRLDLNVSNEFFAEGGKN